MNRSRAEQVREFARDVLAEVSERAPEIEQHRYVPADLARRLAAGGLCHLLTPGAYGGLELALPDAYEVLEDVAEADMSTGWCCAVATTTALVTAFLDPKEVPEVVPTIDTIVCGVAMPTGVARVADGKYRVTGRWQWGSFSNNADVLVLACRVEDPAHSEQQLSRLVLLPSESVSRVDTWFTMGLSGTASVDLVVDDAIVPIEHSIAHVHPRPTSSGALYRIPLESFLGLSLAAVALGNARGALADIVATASEKTPTGTSGSVATKPYAQIKMVGLRARFLAARALFYDVVRRVWSDVQAGTDPTPIDRAELRMAAVHAARTSAEVVLGAHELAGGTSVFSSNRLQRRLRDAQVATQHRMISEVNHAYIGQTLFGLGSHDLLDRYKI